MISNYVKFPRERGIVVFEVELIFTLRNDVLVVSLRDIPEAGWEGD